MAGNEPKVVFGDEKSSYTFKSKLTADGYNFEYKALNFAVPISSVSDVAVINLPSGGEMKGGAINVYPQQDASASSYKAVVAIKGPKSGAAANVYSSAVVGSNAGGTQRARNMKIDLSGYVNWRLYDKVSGTISLTTGSSLGRAGESEPSKYGKTPETPGINAVWRRAIRLRMTEETPVRAGYPEWDV